MASPFSALKATAFGTTATIFGEVCRWTPAAGGAEQVATVHFNRPDEPDPLGDLNAVEWEFTPMDTWIEYLAPTFPGLKSSVDNGTRETVSVTDPITSTATTYRVTKVMRVFDGDTYRAQLRLV